jgi:mannose-6-phosphate isomerase-like protein (cupin superfamily)
MSVRRVVTGHDARGRAVIVLDGPARSIPVAAVPGTVFHEIWSTAGSPAPLDDGPDPALAELALEPPPGGSRVRVVEIPPDSVQASLSQGDVAAAFDEIGAGAAAGARPDAPHPLMHRTETVDYGIVLEGEVWLVVDDGEARLGPGDVVVQRATNHAWSNRTDTVARMAFVLLDARQADRSRR